MRVAVALLALPLLSCNPVVTGASADHVTMKYDPGLTGRAEVKAEAAAYCRERGFRDAIFVSDSQQTPLSIRYDTFRCTD